MSSAGAHLRGLTAPQQAALAQRLTGSAGGAADKPRHGRHLMQGKVRRNIFISSYTCIYL